jgi:GH18 family chitinase
MAAVRYTQAVVNPHTNLTEIAQGLDLLWRNNIPSTKVVMGLGFYGRSFTLSNPSCNTTGCPFKSGGKPGECTNTAGILSNAEIQAIIRQNNLQPTLDAAAGVKYMSWGGDQWVSYDDADTFKIKMDFANRLGLGGMSTFTQARLEDAEVGRATANQPTRHQWYGPWTLTMLTRNRRSISALEEQWPTITGLTCRGKRPTRTRPLLDTSLIGLLA